MSHPYFCLAPMVLGKFEIALGRPYTFRYHLHVHDGSPGPEAIERLWNDSAAPRPPASSRTGLTGE